MKVPNPLQDLRFRTILHARGPQGLMLMASFLLVMLSGCYQLTLQSAGEEPLLLNDQSVLTGTQYRVVRHFYRQQQLDYVFGVNDQQDLIVSRMLLEEAGPDAGVINLQVRRTYNALDAVVSVFTLGIYTRAWVIVEGDVIEWKRP